MGNPNATDEEVEEAARQSGCDSFIRALDNGYDTVAGGGGGHLSGGEKQRISIARAMLKNAPIVILDEATASVDPERSTNTKSTVSINSREDIDCYRTPAFHNCGCRSDYSNRKRMCCGMRKAGRIISRLPAVRKHVESTSGIQRPDGRGGTKRCFK